MNTLLWLVVALTPGDDALTPPADTLTPPAEVFSAKPDTLTPPAPEPLTPPPPEKPRRGYTECLEAVRAGGTVHLAVGVDPKVGDYYIRSLDGPDGKPVVNGRYRCWPVGGDPKWELVLPPATVASGGDHTCPKCGTTQHAQSGVNPDGSHAHTCPNGGCGYSWSHGGTLGYPGTRLQYQYPFAARLGG